MSVQYTDQSQATGNHTIQSRQDYRDDPDGGYKYWSDELKGSMRMLRRWHRQADLIHQRYLDIRLAQGSQTPGYTGENSTNSHPSYFRLNLFYSNVTTLRSLLYGNLPEVDVSRRYADANDDVGRVASQILERLLNNDIVDREEEVDSVLRATLEDRLVPGLGVARVRYDCETQEIAQEPILGENNTVLAAETVQKKLVDEFAPIDYFHWRDVLWSWSRTFADIRWIAFRHHMTKDEATKKYGKKIAEALEYKQQKMVNQGNNNDTPDDPEHNDAWMKADVWEVWDKQSRQVIDIHLKHNKLLKLTEDPLQLRNFFPTPPFFIANASTSLYKPQPDFHLAQDLYNEIDKLQTRIAIITEAIKVVGVYDSSTPELSRMLKEGTENDLIPVQNWAMFAEKGGLNGAIDWFPIKDVVDALVNLRQVRDETIALLYQIIGVNDIMRGQLDNQYEAKGQSDIKQQYASIRVQALQESFADFASGLMQIKAEIIARHFDVETIQRKANMDYSFEDPQLVQEALALIKQPEHSRLRVKIKSDSLAMVDYQRKQSERVEFLNGLSTFLQSAAPLTEQQPATAPFLLQLLQWGLSGFRGADEIEGVIDRAVIAAQEAAANAQDQPDPELMKLQAQQQLEETKAAAQIQAIQAKAQAESQQRQLDHQLDLELKQFEHQTNMAEAIGDMERSIAEIKAKAEADVYTEAMTSEVNAQQQAQGVEAEAHKDMIDHNLELEKIAVDTAAKIEEAQATAKIKQTAETSSDSGD